MSRKTYVLGVDGGGTKTLAMVGDINGHVLAQKETTGTNPNLIGIEGAAKTIAKLVKACAEEVRCTVDEIQPMVMGIAGAGRVQDRKRLAEEISTHLGTKSSDVLIETDTRIALEGAFAGGPGVVVIAGTGSAVIGKTDRGDIINVGGWGRLLGDEGSGYFIGHEALALVTMHFDKRADSGKLKEAFARAYHWDSREQIIAAIYQEKFDISTLAPLVVETAAGNDVVAQRIIQKAATLLAEQASAVVRHMGILRKVGLVMVGGLVKKDSVYANVLTMKLMKSLPQVDIRQPLHPPAYGAILIALERLKTSG